MNKPNLNKPTLCFDYEFLLFQAACVNEKTTLKVVNKITQEEFIFKNKSEFHGRGKAKDGGELAKWNSTRTSPWVLDDFLIFEERSAGPIENAIYILNNSIKKICKELDTNKYYGYAGRGETTLRNKICTLMDYKGNRVNLVKPAHLEDLKDYLNQHHNCEIVYDLEADDHCSMDAWWCFHKFKKSGNLKDQLITVAVDKDAKGVTGFLYNPNKSFEPEKIEGLGSIWKDEKEVNGQGRAWLYWQIAVGDTSDNYKPNCFSDLRVGEAGALKAFEGCCTDKMYWQALVDFYKRMYPEPKLITNFRGDEFQIDWLYVLQEMTLMAHMLRWEDDLLNVKEILKKLEVNY